MDSRRWLESRGYFDRLREEVRQGQLDDEIASDIDAIRDGTFVPAPEPQDGTF